MTKTFFQDHGLSVEYSDKVSGNVPEPIGFLDKEVISYSHVISAFGGFDSANIGISASALDSERWLLDGLGRHISVKSERGIAWEGFVDEIVYSTGISTLSIGPLMNIANRVSVRYSEVFTTTSGVTGTSAITTIQDDSASQEEYGIIEKVLSGGSMFFDEAEQVRDTFLQDKKRPTTSNNFNFSSSSTTPSLQLRCRGYHAWLDAFIYEDTTVGVVAVSTKVDDVIDADPNSKIFDKYISTNSSLTSSEEIDYRTGLTVIKSCANLGDGNDNRWLFMVYDNRRAEFLAVNPEPAYVINVVDNKHLITAGGGRIVEPWNVRAGVWIESRDVPMIYTPYQYTVDDRWNNPHTTFIESVSYNMPYGLSLSGSTIEKTPQALAKYGIGAMI